VFPEKSGTGPDNHDWQSAGLMTAGRIYLTDYSFTKQLQTFQNPGTKD
jgi:hypothetical protein